MKKIVLVGVCILCLLATLLTSACKGPAGPTEPTQVDFDAAAAEAMPEYHFAYAGDAKVENEDYTPWTDDTRAQKTGDADKYIVCTDAQGNQSLVYLYTDICYDAASTYRYVDAYMPTDSAHLDPATPVFLYLHGGGWIAGSRKDEALSLVPYLVKAGFVVISMEYGLWFGMNQREDVNLGVYGWHDLNVLDIVDYIFKNEHPVSVYDMMDDITACLNYLKTDYLPSLGLTCTNIGIGGYSAGGHLSSLYAYKYAATSPIEIAFELDLVGPVRLLDEGYLHVVSLLLGKDENGDPIKTNNFILDLILYMLTDEDAREDLPVPEMMQGILGAKEPIDITTSEGWAKAEEEIALVQGYTYLCETSVPTVICYARQHPDSVKFLEDIFPDDFDLFIPITVYTSMSARLDEVGIAHADRLFENENHNTIGHSTEPCRWMATQCRAMAQLYCH